MLIAITWVMVSGGNCSVLRRRWGYRCLWGTLVVTIASAMIAISWQRPKSSPGAIMSPTSLSIVIMATLAARGPLPWRGAACTWTRWWRTTSASTRWERCLRTYRASSWWLWWLWCPWTCRGWWCFRHVFMLCKSLETIIRTNVTNELCQLKKCLANKLGLYPVMKNHWQQKLKPILTTTLMQQLTCKLHFVTVSYISQTKCQPTEPWPNQPTVTAHTPRSQASGGHVELLPRLVLLLKTNN